MGGAFGYTASMVVVGFNFRRKRNLALGVSNAGIGLGLFVFAPVMQLARDYYGTFGYFFIMAAIAANLVTFGAVCYPSKLELYTHSVRARSSRSAEANQSVGDMFKTYCRVLTNKGIFMLCVAMFFYCIGTYLVYLYLPSYVVYRNISPSYASMLMSISGVGSVIGRFLTGAIANLKRVNCLLIYSGSIVIIAIVTVIYPFMSSTYAGNVAFVVVYGLFIGSCFVVTTSVSLLFVDIEHLSASIGLQFACGGVGGIVGPVLAGE